MKVAFLLSLFLALPIFAQLDFNTPVEVINKSPIGAGNQAVTLGPIDDHVDEVHLVLKNDTSGTFTINASVGETIDFEGFKTLTNTGDFIGLVKDPTTQTNWSIVSLDTNVTPEKVYFYFSVWAEESGALSNNNRQYSFGNGATGNINVPIPEAELFAVGFDAEVVGTSVSIEVMRNDAAVTSQLFTGGGGYNILATPVSFSVGDFVGFRTDVETGAYSDARAVAWFRVEVQGLKGEKGDQGGLLWRGSWTVGTYNIDDVVQFSGSSYIANTTTSQQPPDSDWDLVSSKGDQGTSSSVLVLGKSSGANQDVGGANGAEVFWTWDQQDIVDAGFSHTLGSSQVTVTDSGNYEISFTGSGQQEGAARTTLMGVYRINGGVTLRKGSLRNYSRGAGYGNISAGLKCLIALSAGDVIEVGTRVDDTDGVYTINTSGGEIQDDEHILIIKKL